MKRVLVTGATGFVGSTLCSVLHAKGYRVRAALREPAFGGAIAEERVVVSDIGSSTDWSAALQGIDLVVHAAARAHVLRDHGENAGLYTETNATGTKRLAEAAVQYGVKRLVFLSSIKVNGEESVGRAYGPHDAPAPLDAYGHSKWLAERYLREISDEDGLEVAIVRPPLVYGPGVRANFLRLMHWVEKGVPLPLGGIDNRRSLVNIWNLCDLVATLLYDPRAPGRVWMVSDGEDLSTPDLIRAIADAMGRRARLLPMPPGIMNWAARVLGRGDEIKRLCGSLVVDIEATRRLLDWHPPVELREGLKRTADWYLHQRCPP